MSMCLVQCPAGKLKAAYGGLLESTCWRVLKVCGSRGTRGNDNAQHMVRLCASVLVVFSCAVAGCESLSGTLCCYPPG
jgi:hypothetical protein